MSQSDARKAKRKAARDCEKRGHLPKTDGQGNTYCARCEAIL